MESNFIDIAIFSLEFNPKCNPKTPHYNHHHPHLLDFGCQPNLETLLIGDPRARGKQPHVFNSCLVIPLVFHNQHVLGEQQQRSSSPPHPLRLQASLLVLI